MESQYPRWQSTVALYGVHGWVSSSWDKSKESYHSTILLGCRYVRQCCNEIVGYIPVIAVAFVFDGHSYIEDDVVAKLVC